MDRRQKISRSLKSATSDENFLNLIKKVETLVSKVLSLLMVVVTLVAVVELCIFLTREMLFNDKMSDPDQFFSVTLLSVFGLFLNILIALEILENITAYLRKHVVQLELVIITSLTAVARKIIIFDFSKSSGLELVALGVAIFALSISYWLVRRTNKRYE